MNMILLMCCHRSILLELCFIEPVLCSLEHFGAFLSLKRCFLWSRGFLFHSVNTYGSDRNSEPFPQVHLFWLQDWVRSHEWAIWVSVLYNFPLLCLLHHPVKDLCFTQMTCLPHMTVSSKLALHTIENTSLITVAATREVSKGTYWMNAGRSTHSCSHACVCVLFRVTYEKRLKEE